jgi:uracil-DNA glycosylase
MISWHDFFQQEKQLPYMMALREQLEREREQYTIYPPKDLVFNALKQTSLEGLKVIILGQDPYHGKSQAMGLAFSVSNNVPLPPSLKNIFKEIEHDLNIKMNSSGDLTPWAKQGVLLLNTYLTVREGQPLSHQNIGWHTFTSHLIEFILKHSRPLVFLLWGKFAQKKVESCLQLSVSHESNLILKAVHPSPLSFHRGFLGCGHFSKANEWLKLNGLCPIDWQL